MTTRRFTSDWLAAVLAALMCLVVARAGAAQQCPIPAGDFEPDPEFSSSFLNKSCTFLHNGKNPFFVLKPGWRLVLESEDEVAEITVLDKTKTVAGVVTRVIEELAFEKDGDELLLIERSLNYFAICKQTNSVFYFGEDSKEFDGHGNVTSTAGSWLAGKHGAKAGIIMPGTFLTGGGYYQEIAPVDSALDKARIDGLRNECEAGDFEFERQCLDTTETSDCSPDEESTKTYVKGIGLVLDDELEITSYGFVDDEDDDD